MTLWATIIQWFELEYGYNSDPSTVPDGDLLRWAMERRAITQRQTTRLQGDAIMATTPTPNPPKPPTPTPPPPSTPSPNPNPPVTNPQS